MAGSKDRMGHRHIAATCASVSAGTVARSLVLEELLLLHFRFARQVPEFMIHWV